MVWITAPLDTASITRYRFCYPLEYLCAMSVPRRLCPRFCALFLSAFGALDGYLAQWPFSYLLELSSRFQHLLHYTQALIPFPKFSLQGYIAGNRSFIPVTCLHPTLCFGLEPSTIILPHSACTITASEILRAVRCPRCERIFPTCIPTLWRLPCPHQGFDGFARLLAALPSSPGYSGLPEDFHPFLGELCSKSSLRLPRSRWGGRQ